MTKNPTTPKGVVPKIMAFAMRTYGIPTMALVFFAAVLLQS